MGSYVGRRSVPQETVGAVPIGGIIMWSGAVTDVPDRWALCDGSNGTPDLRGKFVAGADTGTEGQQGGANSMVLTSDQLPLHSHNVPATTVSTGSESATHTHYVQTGDPDTNHTHSGSTGNVSAWHTHNTSNDVYRNISPHLVINSPGGQWYGTPTISTTDYPSANHNHSFSTGNVSAWHKHTATSQGQSTNHTHNVTIGARNTDNTGSGNSFDNRPAYYALAYIMRKS